MASCSEVGVCEVKDGSCQCSDHGAVSHRLTSVFHSVVDSKTGTSIDLFNKTTCMRRVAPIDLFVEKSPIGDRYRSNGEK